MGHPTDLDAKAKGENSMLGKRKTAEDETLGRFRKTRDLWQERDCPKFNLHGEQSHSHRQASGADALLWERLPK